jgi:hypothetical protein
MFFTLACAKKRFQPVHICLPFAFFKTMRPDVLRLKLTVVKQWEPMLPTVGTQCCETMIWDHIGANMTEDATTT